MEKTYQFEDNEITFTIDKDKNVMVNATEMAKIFDKKVENFTRIEQTQNFIQSCLKFASIDENKTPNSVLFDVKCEEDLIVSRQKSGTFMHRVLALKFAAWLSPDFEVWVYSTIDDILFGAYKDDEKTEKEIGRIQAQISQKEKELSDNPIHEEIAKLKKEESKARNILNARRRNRTQGFRTMFTEAEMNNSE